MATPIKNPVHLESKESKYVKILNESMIHKGFKYQLGLNVDTKPFDPSGSCRPGGLYFTNLTNFYKFLGYGTLIADVEVPEGTEIYADPEGDKWKAHSIIISNIRPIETLPQWSDVQFCLAVVSKYPSALQFVNYRKFNRDDYEHICLTAVRNDGKSVRYIDPARQLNNICYYAVKSSHDAVCYISPEKRSYFVGY